VARDPDSIERDIEQAREALANTLDELGERAHPKHLMDQGKQQLQTTLDDPRVRYSLIGSGVLIALLLLRKLIR
jgi:hypothetical protein